MKHLRYLAYVLQHKLFVFMASWTYGCVRQGLTHDSSKFLPSEWFPYAEKFYGESIQARADVNKRFADACERHYNRNGHHWQQWLRDGDTPLEMPEIYVREMLSDWTGVAMYRGKTNCIGWYLSERNNIELHPETRALVEMLLGIKQEDVEK